MSEVLDGSSSEGHGSVAAATVEFAGDAADPERGAAAVLDRDRQGTASRLCSPRRRCVATVPAAVVRNTSGM